MFSLYLKQKRIERNLTQSNLAAQLNLYSEGFQKLDSVTISRWERGTTSPPIYKAIQVARFFELDIFDLLLNLSVDSKEKKYEDLLLSQFNSYSSKIKTVSYDSNNEKIDIELIQKSLDIDNGYERFASAIEQYYHSLDFQDEKENIESIDIPLLHSRNKCDIYRYSNLHNNKKSGHNLNFYYLVDDIKNELRSKKTNISLTNTTSYTKTKEDMALYNYSSFSIDKDTFNYLNYNILVNLARKSNITMYYVKTYGKDMFTHLIYLGFQIECYGVKSDTGEFNVGNISYRECILSINTSLLLANKEVLRFMQEQHNKAYFSEK
jgi:transcriptional regulator with XRE-family HTH domain